MRASSDNTVLAIAISIFALILFDCMGLLIKHLSVRYTAMELSAYDVIMRSFMFSPNNCSYLKFY